MTFQERFTQLKNTYADRADFSSVRENIAAEITLTDEDCGGTFYVAVRNGRAEIEPFNYYDATVRIRLPGALLEALLEGRKNPVNEFLLGNVDAEGEPGHALALIDAMKLKKRKK